MTPGMLADFAILRVAALPYERLVALAPPRTTALIVDARAAQDVMNAHRPALERALHALVPTIDDRALRGAVIRLNREIHNGRSPRLSAEVEHEIQRRLAAEDVAHFVGWLAAERAASEAGRAAEAIHDDEIRSHLRPALRALASEPVFARPLALSSPQLFEQLCREATHLPTSAASSKSERSLLGYVARATAKTSPFSTFMGIAPITLAAGPTRVPSIEGIPLRARVSLNRGILDVLGRVGIAPHQREYTTYTKNPTLRAIEHQRLEALIGEYVAVNRRGWRSERHVSVRAHPTLVAAVMTLPSSFGWDQLVLQLEHAGLVRAAALAFAEKLVARGLVHAEATTDAFDDAPDAALIDQLGRPGAERVLPAVRDAVCGLVAVAGELADAEAPRRIELVRHGDALIRAAWTSLGLTADPVRNPIVEDGAFERPAGTLGGDGFALLREVADVIRPLVVVSPAYSALRDRFVELHGEGGRCGDVVQFVREVFAEPRRPSVREALRPARPRQRRAGVTAFCQIAATDLSSASDAIVVINKAYGGIGWLSARRAMGAGAEAAELREQLTRWLVEANHPREPIDLPVCGECNDLQAHPRLTGRVIGWPTEPLRVTPHDVLPASELELVHDRDTDLLELIDRTGSPIAPVYLGNAAPSPAWGPLYVLGLLAQPFELARPRMAPPEPGVAREVEHRGRIQQGRVVLTRSTWWVRTEYLRSKWLRRTGARRLLDVAIDRDAIGIPRTCFVNAYVPPSAEYSSLAADVVKPLWVDTTNPFCLELLERLVAISEWITIKEVLPGPDQLWVRVGDANYASEIAVEMVV